MTAEYQPFGNYPEPCVGRLLNQLSTNHHLAIMAIEQLLVGSMDPKQHTGDLKRNSEVVGTYRWFGKDVLVRWYGSHAGFNNQVAVIDEAGKLRPHFHLNLSPQWDPCLEVEGKLASLELREFIKKVMLTTDIHHPAYKLHSAAVAAHHNWMEQAVDPGNYIRIDFCNHNLENAQAWLDYLNQHFSNWS